MTRLPITTLAAAATIAATMAGCTMVRYVPVESASGTDSIRIIALRTDTLRVTDSTVIDRSADTVRIDRWRTVWRDSHTTDTVTRTRNDTIRLPYPVETCVEVAAPLSGWKKTLMIIGGASALVIAIRLVSLLRNWRR